MIYNSKVRGPYARKCTMGLNVSGGHDYLIELTVVSMMADLSRRPLIAANVCDYIAGIGKHRYTGPKKR